MLPECPGGCGKEAAPAVNTENINWPPRGSNLQPRETARTAHWHGHRGACERAFGPAPPRSHGPHPAHAMTHIYSTGSSRRWSLLTLTSLHADRWHSPDVCRWPLGSNGTCYEFSMKNYFFGWVLTCAI